MSLRSLLALMLALLLLPGCGDLGAIVQCTADEDCGAGSECTEEGLCIELGRTEGMNAGECSDGADNDQDGLYDCEDPDCLTAPDCQGDDDDDDDDHTVDDDDDSGDDDDVVGDDDTGDDDDDAGDDDDTGDDDDVVGDDDDSGDGCWSLDFDGIDDYISLPHDSTNIAGASQVTVEAWVKRSSEALMTIFSQWTTTSGPGHVGLMWSIQADGDMVVCTNGGSCPWESSPIPLNAWSHVALVFDSGALDMYIDGSPSGSFSTGDTTIGSGSDHTRFGAAQYVDWNNFDGSIRDVRVWNTARTPAELSDNMWTPPTGSEPGLAGHWLLGDGSGSLADDNSGNGGDGTIHGASWTEDCPAGDDDAGDDDTGDDDDSSGAGAVPLETTAS